MSSMTMMSRARGRAARSQTRRTRVCVAVVLVRTGTGLNIPHDVNHHAAPRDGISLLSQGSKEVEREPSKLSLLQKRRSAIDCCYEEKVVRDDDALEVQDKDDENTKKLEGGEDKNNAEQEKKEEDERKKHLETIASERNYVDPVFLELHRHRAEASSESERGTSSSELSKVKKRHEQEQGDDDEGPCKHDLDVCEDPYGVRTLDDWYHNLSWDRSTLQTEKLSRKNLQNALWEYGVGVCMYQFKPTLLSHGRVSVGGVGDVCSKPAREHLFYPVGLGKDWGKPKVVQDKLQPDTPATSEKSVWWKYYQGNELKAVREKKHKTHELEISAPKSDWPNWFDNGQICELGCYTGPHYAAAVSEKNFGARRITVLGQGPTKKVSTLSMQWAFTFLTEAWCPNMLTGRLVRQGYNESPEDWAKRKNVLERACLKMPGWLSTEEMQLVVKKYFSALCTTFGRATPTSKCEKINMRRQFVPGKTGIKGHPGFAGASMPPWLPTDGKLCFMDGDEHCKPLFMQPGSEYEKNFDEAAKDVADFAFRLNEIRDFCEGMVAARGKVRGLALFKFYFHSDRGNLWMHESGINPKYLYPACLKLQDTLLEITRKIPPPPEKGGAHLGPKKTSRQREDENPAAAGGRSEGPPAPTPRTADPAPAPEPEPTPSPHNDTPHNPADPAPTPEPEPTPSPHNDTPHNTTHHEPKPKKMKRWCGCPIYLLIPLAFLALLGAFCCCTSLLLLAAAVAKKEDKKDGEPGAAENAAYLAEEPHSPTFGW